MSIGPLSGFTVGVTSERRSDEQTSLLERRGAKVVHAPVICTAPLDDETATSQAIDALVACPPDVVVVSTALGLRSWLSAAADLDVEHRLLDALRPAEIVARGHRAVSAAMAAGLERVVPPSSPTYDGIVTDFARRSPRRCDGRPVRVAVQLDGDGSAGLADRLRGLGYDVVPVPVYRWDLPDDIGPAERLVAAAAERRIDAITFTCAHSVDNFVAIAQRVGSLDEVRAVIASGALTTVAVGAATGERLRRSSLGDPIEPAQPRLASMVQRLARSLATRAAQAQLPPRGELTAATRRPGAGTHSVTVKGAWMPSPTMPGLQAVV